VLAAAGVVSILTLGPSRAPTGPVTSPASNAVLDTGSLWRCHFTWKTEQARRASGDLRYVTVRPRWGRASLGVKRIDEPIRTALPPEGDARGSGAWTRPAFDDSAWARARGPFSVRATRTLALLCLRGTFEVTDPATAGPLTLSLTFHGGVVVYVNGRELTRSHLPAGAIDLETPADDYPTEAYVDPDGFLLRWEWGDPEEYPERFALRDRHLAGVTIPASMLRKGVNVLAVELHRAPTAEVMFSSRPRRYARKFTLWSMLGLLDLRLTAPAGAQGVAGADRPAAWQVWNQPTIQRVHAHDYGDPREPLRPIEIHGTRNGAFSGQVVVRSTAPIRGLTATVSDLAGAGGRAIPASAITIRYGKWARDTSSGTASAEEKGAPPGGRRVPVSCDALTDKPPAEVPVEPTGGAVQPIRVTVHVPREARAGAYTASLTIRQDGDTMPSPEQPLPAGGAARSREGVAPPFSVTVPINLTVADWTLPDPTEFVTHIGLIQSPDTLAIKYNVPMWSDAHWRLIDRSFELLGQVGTKVIYIPVLRRTYFGNEHSMVRWIKKTGGGYTHDFSIVERYVETAVKHLGTVPVVCVYCWEINTGSAYMGVLYERKSEGMPFTILDPATGRFKAAVGPMWGSGAIRPFWKPVMDGIRAILARHDLGRSMMVGIAGDRRPNKEAVADLKAVAPRAKWVVSSHNTPTALHGQPVGYSTGVWGLGPAPDPAKARHHGWRNWFRLAVFPRFGSEVIGHSLQTHSRLATYRVATEAALAARGKGEGLRGIGRCGADFWPVLPGRRGLKPVCGRYPETAGWHGGWLDASFPAILAPGADGPVATTRFEAFREGLQETEARIFIERALLDPATRARLGDDLAARCQGVLDERTRAIRRAIADRGSHLTWTWFVGSGWQERSAALYAAAAEVAAKVEPTEGRETERTAADGQ